MVQLNSIQINCLGNEMFISVCRKSPDGEHEQARQSVVIFVVTSFFVLNGVNRNRAEIKIQNENNTIQLPVNDDKNQKKFSAATDPYDQVGQITPTD